MIHAENRGEHRIHLTLNDCSKGTVDFSCWLEGPVFEPLEDPDSFGRLFVEGGTVTWPNGADVSPETLHQRVRDPAAA